MAVTAATPIAEAKVLLNDPSGLNYTTIKLLPCLNKAYRDLQLKMKQNGMQSFKEISAPITVAAGTVRLGDGAGLPNDFVYPVWVKERGSTSEEWQDMTEQNWEPQFNTPGPRLNYWVWREDELKFPPSSADRLVLLGYLKSQITIDEVDDPILIADSIGFLAARTAAIAALVIGENKTRADVLNGDADVQWDLMKGTQTKLAQRMGVRRRTNRYRQ